MNNELKTMFGLGCSVSLLCNCYAEQRTCARANKSLISMSKCSVFATLHIFSKKESREKRAIAWKFSQKRCVFNKKIGIQRLSVQRFYKYEF